jgi:hypothetical protein
MSKIDQNTLTRDALLSRISDAQCDGKGSISNKDMLKYIAKLEARIKYLEKENKILRANCSKSVMRRLTAQFYQRNENES